MDFGLFNLMGYRDPGTSTANILEHTVEQVVAAEGLGFSIAWFAEHHFSNYCVCPSPLLMAAYCAGHTDRIRLGTGVLVLPLYQPSRLIAEIAMMDALTKGRLVLGVGSGYQPYEFDRFGVDLSTSKPMTEELLEMIELGLSGQSFEYQGQYYHLPRSLIGPRCTKLPEVWLAGESLPTQRYAARKGYKSIVSGRLADAAGLARIRSGCEEAYVAEGKDPNAMPISVLRYACVTDSHREAEDFADNVRYQLRLASSLRNRRESLVAGMLADPPYPGDLPTEQVIKNLMIGDPETCAERAVAEIRAMRPLHVAIYFQVGSFPHRQALQSIERFAGEVIPMIEKELGPLEEIGERAALSSGVNRRTISAN
jgi:alkanesulfonate monooxygenase SsuD/methylene tetrahydromethanopterin reductase-like flavin-dependent oxidoreductase (luciferase family)